MGGVNRLMNFGQLRNFGIKEEVLTGLNGLGFIEQTPVQEQVIPLILDGQYLWAYDTKISS